MQNREISWLRFNHRVLHLAENKDVPLLERLKFLQIFTSNLDEFFMIRMGTLYNMKKENPHHIDIKSGMSLKEEITTILDKTRSLYLEKDTVYQELIDELRAEGIEEVNMDDLSMEEMQYLRKYFKSYIKPVLSPQIIDKHHPFPHLANKELHYVAFLQLGKKKKFAMIPVPTSIPKVIFLKGETIRYVRVEKLVAHFAKGVFSETEIIEANIIRATRNEDISIGDETIEDELYY